MTTIIFLTYPHHRPPIKSQLGLHYKINGMMHETICKPVEVFESHKYLPCISIVMPFESQITPKSELVSKLNNAAAAMRSELFINYPEDKWVPAMKRLEQIIKDLNYYTFKKSIAIFISPLVERVYYLDIQVEETISIDDSFNIRDLVYSKKQTMSYLLVVLSSSRTKIYTCTSHSLSLVISNVPNNMEGSQEHENNDTNRCRLESKTDTVSDHDFFEYTDQSLALLLQSQPLPVIVVGNEKSVNEFKKTTINQAHVIKYLTGNFEQYTSENLLTLMKPVADDWRVIKQADLRKQICDSLKNGNLVSGINEVLQSVSRKGKRFLLMEKRIRYPFKSMSIAIPFLSNSYAAKNAFYLNDIVDFVIERVLESGGDVEFMEDGALADYGGIVVIE